MENEARSMKIFIERNQAETKKFTNPLCLILACMGCVIGTGNIWRFPRIVALASSERGGLAFILIWVIFLFTWSVPLSITEYTMGRFTRCSPTAAFRKFLGTKYVWLGFWITTVTFAISAYFNVIVGWCLYYVYIAMRPDDLPNTQEKSIRIFNSFVGTNWPLLTHFIGLVLCGASVFKDVKGIEMVNSFLVPLQLCIILFTFGWSLTRKYADQGILFLFTPDWSVLRKANIYVEAAAQNSFDTGAGMGLLSAYAAYFSRKDRAVCYGIFLPIINNMVSLICGMMIFATVFSSLIQTHPTYTYSQIVEILKTSGPASTGLTFTWIPVLLSNVGVFGRILCASFFICISMAGLTSMISYVELTARTIQDCGVSRNKATTAALIVTFILGIPSALNIAALQNQDFVWSSALVLSGLSFWIVVICYGPRRYEKIIVNDFAVNDWRLGYPWLISFCGLVPIEVIALLAWWMFKLIADDANWYIPGVNSVMTLLIEWIGLLIIVVAINWIIYRFKPSALPDQRGSGYDPHHPEASIGSQTTLDSLDVSVTPQF